MGKTWWLLFITALLAVWNAGIVWFTQIAVYPLWPLVGADHFHDYHLAWWHDMWPSFGPVVLMLVCSVILLWTRPLGISRWPLWLGVLLQVGVHTLTAFFWGPDPSHHGHREWHVLGEVSGVDEHTLVSGDFLSRLRGSYDMGLSFFHFGILHREECET